MSNIGKKPVQIKPGVQVQVNDNRIVVAGSKGALESTLPAGIGVEVDGETIKVKKQYESRELEKYLGLSRALIASMVLGVSEGFEKQLELSGVGYRASVSGENLVLNVGYAHPVTVTPPKGISIQVQEGVITVSGIDKKLVGDTAADIRKIRPPDVYKGKGIKYKGEKLRKKVGKAAKAAGAK